jgi:hypothetical protein
MVYRYLIGLLGIAFLVACTTGGRPSGAKSGGASPGGASRAGASLGGANPGPASKSGQGIDNRKLRGETAADQRLAADAYVMFSATASAQLKCKAIDYAEVTSSKISGRNAAEVWVAHGCQKTVPFNVEFSPAPQGGYTIAIKTAKP